jgi:hypothetical protein
MGFGCLFLPPGVIFLGDVQSGHWWVEDFRGGHFSMSITITTQFHKQGLHIVGDLWNPKTKAFHFWEEIQGSYGLEEGERIIWERIIESLPKEWTHRFIERIETPKDK